MRNTEILGFNLLQNVKKIASSYLSDKSEQALAMTEIATSLRGTKQSHCYTSKINNQIKRFWLILPLLFLNIAPSHAQSVYLPHYTTKNGLPSNNCYYTLQDSKGYIWVATDAGVSRFDGAVFENFSVDDGLPDNQILQLREDSKGRVWFLSLNGKLSYYLNGRIYNADNDKKLALININAIIVSFFEDASGNIWFGTNKNLIARWDGKRLQKFTAQTASNQFINAYINQDSKGIIWAYGSAGIFKFNNHSFQLSSTQNLPLSYKTLKTNTNKSVSLLTKKGLYLHQGNSYSLVHPVDPKISNNAPGYIYTDEKEIWISTNNGAFSINYSGQTKRFLPYNAINQIIKDKFNNIWFTTKNGIYRLPEEKERLYIFDSRNGLANNEVKSISISKNKNIWLGLSNGMINKINIRDKKTAVINLPDKEQYNNIKQLVIDTANNQLFFASDFGLGRYALDNQNVPINYLSETNNSMFVVKNFSIDGGNKLALALSSGVVILNDRNKLQFSASAFKEKQDFFADRSYRTYYDNNNKLWFSNIYGLSELNANGINKHFEQSALLKNRINDIKQYAKDTMALATDGYGIIFFCKNKVIKQITTRNGLSNNIIKNLFVKDRFLWAISNTGVNRILFKNNKLDVNTFDYTSDLLSNDLNDLYIDTDTAYFATNNGLIYFQYSQFSKQGQKPQTYITAIYKDKKLINLGTTLVFSPGEHNIIFNYSAVDFKNKNIIYRYRLKSNANWTETKNRRLELSSLEPGDYCFEVSAKSQDGQWGNPAKINFTLKEYFWQSWWFISLLVIVGALLLYKITADITRRQKNKEQEQLLLKNKILMLEQKALQAMMNPHFVFNVMNSIQHYINTKNTSSANKILTGFAKLIRKNLDIVTKSYINLAEEINYLNLYLSLEKYRFGDKLVYQINVDEDIDKEETFIPSMLLQPFIENAIWHGIMPKDNGGSVKIIMTIKDKDYLSIEITDDGIGIENALLQKKSQHESKGISLTTDRLNLLNQIEAKPIHYSVQQNGKNGTTVKLSLPF